nr:phospholipase-like protein [Tanacetum cinerariifolium]
HIELWVWYMWHFRQSFDDWSMVNCYFLTLLLQDLMSLFYATNEIYPLAWRDVEQVVTKKDLNQKHKHSISGKQCDLGDKYWSDQDGEPFFKYMGSTNPSANKDAVNNLVDALDDLVDENGVVEVDKNLL